MPGLKTIYGRDGIPIADVRAAVIRSWLLNDIGEAIFSIATSSIKCRREVLGYGNYIVVQNDFLPDWVGIIDTPRTWHNGYVEVRAFEVPLILKYRLTPLNLTISGDAGSKVEQLISIANAKAETLIRPGSIYKNGIVSDEVLTGSVYDQIKKIRS